MLTVICSYAEYVLQHVLFYLRRCAGIAVWSSEPWVTQALLVQTVSVTSTVVFTSRTNVKILHSPMHICMLLIEAEPNRTVDNMKKTPSFIPPFNNS